MNKRKRKRISPIPISAIILLSVLIISIICAAAICCNTTDPMGSTEISTKICIPLSFLAGGIALKLCGGTKSELLMFSAAITLLLLAGECFDGIKVVGIIMLCASFAAINAGYFLMTIRRGKRKRR